MKKIRWGIIGCGGIARRRTIPGLLLAKNAVCAAIMDTNEESLNATGEEFGIEKRYLTVEQLLDDKEIDAVYIATPVFCHKEQVFLAARAGKHILLEKPMGLTVAECREIKEICEAAGVKLGVGFMMRFHGAHTEIKKFLNTGAIGEVVSAYAKFNCLYPVSPARWRQTKAFSAGGAMMDMGIHCIDLLTHLTGLKVKKVAAIAGNQIFDYPDVEDAASAVFGMDNGAIFTVEANFNIPDTVGGCKFEIYGTKGSISAVGTIGQLEVGTVQYITEDKADEGYKALPYESGNMYTKETEYFSEAILNGTAAPVSVDEGITDQLIVEAVYESSESGKTVAL